MLMPIGNTVPNLNFRGLSGSAMTGKPVRLFNRSRLDLAKEEPARQCSVGSFRGGIALWAPSVLPWRW